jgi:hypothetical protein
MTLSEKQQTFARNVTTLIEYIYQHGYAVTFGEAYRTPEQAAIYAKEGKGIVDSLHCKRLAIDLNLFKGEEYISDGKVPEYALIGEFWEKLDPLNRWGGRFTRGDYNHYEMQDK